MKSLKSSEEAVSVEATQFICMMMEVIQKHSIYACREGNKTFMWNREVMEEHKIAMYCAGLRLPVSPKLLEPWDLKWEQWLFLFYIGYKSQTNCRTGSDSFGVHGDYSAVHRTSWLFCVICPIAFSLRFFLPIVKIAWDWWGFWHSTLRRYELIDASVGEANRSFQYWNTRTNGVNDEKSWEQH